MIDKYPELVSISESQALTNANRQLIEWASEKKGLNHIIMKHIVIIYFPKFAKILNLQG